MQKQREKERERGPDVHLPKSLSVSSRAWTSVSAFSLVKQSGGLIFMTLRSIPSSLIIMRCFSSILYMCTRQSHDIYTNILDNVKCIKFIDR